MLSFESDYILGAHEKVLEALIKTNSEMLSGYGKDHHTENAKNLIKEACNAPDSEVFFLTGGTQANKTIIATMLEPYEAVIAPKTGHISLHEVGAIEYTGHKVIELDGEAGKLSASTANRDGYTFGGWFTDISLTTPYSQEIISSNTMLYAWWVEETKPVEFTFSGTNSKTITDFVGNSTQVVIPSYIGGHSVECISSMAFNDKHSIISIVVPNTVTDIGMATFKGCSSLERMTLPFVGGSVKTTQDVGQYPFGYIFGKEYYDGRVD